MSGKRKGEGKGCEPNYKDEKVAICVIYGKICITNLPYVKGDEGLRRSQEFIEESELWEAQQCYEQRAEDRKKMDIEDKDQAEACPSEKELRSREEELHENNDSKKAGKEIVKDGTLLEAKSRPEHELSF